MKNKEIRSMDKESLKTKLSELKKELIKINAQVAIGTTPKSPGQVKALKKTVAKIMTIMNEKPTETKEKVVVKKSKEKEVEKKA